MFPKAVPVGRTSIAAFFFLLAGFCTHPPLLLAAEVDTVHPRPLNPEGISQRSRWSPDGQRLAFMSNRDGNDEIYVVRADGTGTTRLTRNGYDDVYPEWSPDGKKIVFSSSALGGTWATPNPSAIFVMDANGENRTRITNTAVGHDRPVPYFFDSQPVWEPNGDRIAFLSDRAGGFREIFVVRPDGSGVTQVTFHRIHHWNIRWTPDGTRIVFDGRLDGFPSPGGNPAWGMHTVRMTGSIHTWGDDVRPLRNDTESSLEYDSAVSPDGRRIVFLKPEVDPSRRTGRRGLVFADLDDSAGFPSVVEGTFEIPSTEDQYSPDWSPDGSRLTFTSVREGHAEIYVMDVHSDRATRLTHSR